MRTEYRVRVERFGVPDKFHAKKDVGRAVKMLQEWEDARERTKGTLNGTAILTIESRDVGDWADIVTGNDEVDQTPSPPWPLSEWQTNDVQTGRQTSFVFQTADEWSKYTGRGNETG